MSRELVIVFLYDCDLCKSEEDDPQQAIIYFYPTWVSGEQRHALCSQLMGVAQFCTSAFSAPAVIALQSGKFVVCRTGRYVLCVGTDRSIPESILRNRLKLLSQFLRLFHCSIESLNAAPSDDDDGLSDTFSTLLQTYLPIALDGANPFENIPLYVIPKDRVSVLEKSRLTLENVISQHGVLGGTVFYQNKVIFTQLSQNLTKLLVLARPHKVKLPAYDVPTSFFLPNGVQLLTVFVDATEVAHLRSQAKSLWSSSLDVTQKALDGLLLVQDVQNRQTEENNFLGSGALSDGKAEPLGANLVDNFADPTVPDLVLDAVRARQLSRWANAETASAVSKSPKNTPSKTTDDILSTNNVPISFGFRVFSLGLPKVSAKWTDGKRTPLRHINKLHFNTICDPKYPLFKPDGLPASYTYYDQNPGCGALNNRPPPKDKGPLTPLMAKLALSITAEETFIDEPLNRDSCVDKHVETGSVGMRSDPEEEKRQNVVQMVLFVLGEESSSVAVLMEKSATRDSQVIHELWEKCSSHLKNLEAELELRSSENGGPEVSSAGEYSYAVVDPDWGPAEKGGFHHACQLEMLTVLDDTLQASPQIVDLLIREEDTVTYGYRCGNSKVFYQQNCSSSTGVPTPADLMGVIPLKATSVLGRDHNIVKTSKGHSG